MEFGVYKLTVLLCFVKYLQSGLNKFSNQIHGEDVEEVFYI